MRVCYCQITKFIDIFSNSYRYTCFSVHSSQLVSLLLQPERCPSAAPRPSARGIRIVPLSVVYLEDRVTRTRPFDSDVNDSHSRLVQLRDPCPPRQRQSTVTPGDTFDAWIVKERGAHQVIKYSKSARKLGGRCCVCRVAGNSV